MDPTESPAYLLREAGPTAARDGALLLLEAAGWSRASLTRWAASGTVLELYDPADAIPCGGAIVEPIGEGGYALHAWVTTLDTTNQTVAGRLVRAIADALRRNGGRRLVVSVGNADRRRLTLLLEAGFRIVPVERVAPQCADGGSCGPSHDLVWVDQEL